MPNATCIQVSSSTPVSNLSKESVLNRRSDSSQHHSRACSLRRHGRGCQCVLQKACLQTSRENRFSLLHHPGLAEKRVLILPTALGSHPWNSIYIPAANLSGTVINASRVLSWRLRRPDSHILIKYLFFFYQSSLV